MQINFNPYRIPEEGASILISCDGNLQEKTVFILHIAVEFIRAYKKNCFTEAIAHKSMNSYPMLPANSKVHNFAVLQQNSGV
jgi:hypothetical protein